MLEPIAYLLLVTVASLSSATYVVLRSRQGARLGSVLLRVGIAAVLWALLLGAVAGSFYSHGFDMPWWVFGLFGSVCMLISALLAVLASHFIGLKKNKS